MIASRISFAPWPAFVTNTPLDQSSQRLPCLSKTKMSSARSQTSGGWPRMDCGSYCRSVSSVATESGCGNGVTMRRNLVSTRGTSRVVMLNSLPITGQPTDEHGWPRMGRMKWKRRCNHSSGHKSEKLFARGESVTNEIVGCGLLAGCSGGLLRLSLRFLRGFGRRLVVSRRRLAGGGIEFGQDALQFLASGFGGVALGVGGHKLLDERRVTHVVEFTALVELPAVVAGIPLGVELDENPIARVALLAVQLWGETVAVNLHVVWHLRPGDFRERREEITEVSEVVDYFTFGRYAGPVGDQRNARAAFEDHAFVAVDLPAADFARDLRRAVVAGENDERLFAQAQLLQFGDEFTDLFVHVNHVVIVECFLTFRAFLRVGRAENRPVDEVRGEIKIKRLV